MAAYNYARFLPEALESIFSQEYPQDRLEVVVVDDGSTDETPAVLARYGDRIRSLRQENQGCAAAFGRGLELATGEHLTLLAADDAYPADRIARLVAALDAHPDAGLVYGDMAIVDEHGAPLHDSYRRAVGLRPLQGRILGDLLVGNCVSGGAMMVRAEHKAEILPVPSEAPYEDWWIACAVAAVAPIVAIDDVVLRYRRHGQNTLSLAGRRRLEVLASELPFRRRLLSSVDTGPDVRPSHLSDALREFDAIVHELSAAAAPIPVTPDREAALAVLDAASAALGLPDVEDAQRLLVCAAVLDHAFDVPRALLAELVAIEAGATHTRV